MWKLSTQTELVKYVYTSVFVFGVSVFNIYLRKGTTTAVTHVVINVFICEKSNPRKFYAR